MKTRDLLIELDNSIHNLLKELNLKNNQINELKLEIKDLRQRLNDSQTNLKVTQDQNNELKVISGLSGNKEHRRLMKLKLNSLIKEVDICIAELKRQKV
ncbi:hypothetical protein GO491_11225 [Flavobacteriaceae bacterium Ap0902]|nr:hypothetical protein [Flavobacteriaceae bacterium Ap0902]